MSSHEPPECSGFVIFFPGVETTRHFLLEWLSYTCRYIPVGLLDVIPQRLNWRPPSYYGRDDLETLMASDSAADWVTRTLFFPFSLVLYVLLRTWLKS
jgi:hypothetical protein